MRLHSVVEECRVEVQSNIRIATIGNIELVGRLGERMAGLEDPTAKIERNMAAMSQEGKSQGAVMEQMKAELKRFREQGDARETRVAAHGSAAAERPLPRTQSWQSPA